MRAARGQDGEGLGFFADQLGWLRRQAGAAAVGIHHAVGTWWPIRRRHAGGVVRRLVSTGG